MSTKPDNAKCCTNCHCQMISIYNLLKGRSICNDCKNFKRREKYNNNEEHRLKLIESASVFKHNKVIERQLKREEEQLNIGIDNKKCKYCSLIKPKDRFRHNRMKCKDCERDNPIEKFKRTIRGRIHSCLIKKDDIP